MADTVNELMARLCSALEHKRCRAAKCQQSSQSVDAINRFVLFSNHLIVRYCERLEPFCDTTDELANEKKLFLKSVNTRLKTIEQKLSRIVGNTRPKKRSTIACDLCRQVVSLTELSAHLDTHLASDSSAQPIVCPVKEEPVFDESDVSNFSAGFADYLSDASEQELPDTVRPNRSPNCSPEPPDTGSPEPPNKKRKEVTKRAKRKVKSECQSGSKGQKQWRFSCPWPSCEEVFRFQEALTRHMCNHTGEFMFHCDWPDCNAQYNHKYKLVEHERQHTGEKPYRCEWPGCDRAFSQRASHRWHVYSHNKDRHLCYHPGCDKSYAFKKDLERHIFNCHRQEDKPFHCTYEGCDRKFAAKVNLRLHMAVHQNRPRYACTHTGCDRSFLNEEALEKHEKRPHERVRKLGNGRNLYKDYKCDWPGCDFQANIASNLRTHRMRVHTMERPEKCHYPGCGFAAVRKFELKLKHTGEMPYPCAFPNCGRRFKSQRALDTHINKNHSNVRLA